MRTLSLLPTTLLLATLTAADDIVTKARIKVQLFAAPAFVSEVSVDAYHMQCLSLDNNLYAPRLVTGAKCVVCLFSLLMGGRIDGRVQSVLVGGHDVAAVLKRDDYWSCAFFRYVATYPLAMAACILALRTAHCGKAKG
jgi:hypothetical protein